MADLLFYLLALGALAFGAGVVAARSPLFSVLALLGVFGCLAVIYLLAGFQFLAVTQVLVYAGAIMVLFLFVIMLLNLADESALAPPLGALRRGRLALASLAAGALAALDARVAGAVGRTGVMLSATDQATIRRFHRRFIEAGLSLRFNSTGRLPQPGYPTYRDLLLERDRKGAQRSFLASEPAFQFGKALQARDLVIPIVGDLAGPTALRAAGDFLRARRTPLVAFYASNVERYLFRDGLWDDFAANLGALPLGPSSTLIRSCFDSCSSMGDSRAVSLLDSMTDLLAAVEAGRVRSYWDVMSRSRR